MESNKKRAITFKLNLFIICCFYSMFLGRRPKRLLRPHHDQKSPGGAFKRINFKPLRVDNLPNSIANKISGEKTIFGRKYLLWISMHFARMTCSSICQDICHLFFRLIFLLIQVAALKQAIAKRYLPNVLFKSRSITLYG